LLKIFVILAIIFKCIYFATLLAAYLRIKDALQKTDYTLSKPVFILLSCSYILFIIPNYNSLYLT